MFTQTFVDGTQKTRKPVTVALSVFLELLALCILILIPLIYTQALPGAQLRNLLIAPSPPIAARPIERVTKPQPRAIARVLNSRILLAPITIPKKVNTMSEAAPAPEVGIAYSAGESDAAINSGFGPSIYWIPSASPPPLRPKPKPASEPIRVTSGVSEANLIRKIQPVYPSIARAARIQGTVEFTAMISKEGDIANLQLVRGHPLLVNAAREAVLRWKYRPTLLNGRPVEVITIIVVNFTLTQ
jgi:periplasmic protein TonB